jgi:predicted molibdopterin-dependent oxidoreductase YjgC
VDLTALLERAGRREIKALLVVGEDLFTAGADAGLLERALAAGTRLVVLASRESRTTASADVVLPVAIFPEVDGTVVSFQGRAQRLRAAYPPPFLARTGFQILSALAEGLGAGPAPARPRDLLAEIGRTIPAFRGLNDDLLGDLGMPLPAAAPAATA